MNRKGSIIEIMTFSLIVFLVVVTLFTVTKAWIVISPELSDASEEVLGYQDSDIQMALQKPTTALNILIFALPFLSVLASIIAIILASQVPVNRAYLPIALIIWIVGAIMAFLTTDALWTVVTNSNFTEIANAHPGLLNFIRYLGYFTTIVGGIILVATYAKSRTEGGASAEF